MNDILKGQRGLSPILKSLKTVNKARGASKQATLKAKELKTLKQQYEKTLSDIEKEKGYYDMYGGEAHYSVPYDEYSSKVQQLDKLKNQISNLEFELKLPVSNPYSLSNDYYWQYRKTSPELQQSSYRLFGPLPPIDELPKFIHPNPTQDAIDDLPFKNGGTIKSIF